MFNEKSARDRDTAAFLFEVQSKFYSETYAYLRQLGFKGLIAPSNWATASPEVFGIPALRGQDFKDISRVPWGVYGEDTQYKRGG
jgi:hypothetical protein